MNLLSGAFDDAGSSSYWSRFLSACASSVMSRIATGFRVSLTNINVSLYLALAKGNNDHAVIRISVPAIVISPPSESASNTHTSRSDSMSSLLSKNVEVRGVTVTVSRKEGYVKKSDGSFHTSNSGYLNKVPSAGQGLGMGLGTSTGVGVAGVAGGSKREYYRIVKPLDFLYTTHSPLTDVLLNPIHLTLSIVVSTVQSPPPNKSRHPDPKSKHHLSLDLICNNIEVSPTFQQLHLLAEAVSAVMLEQTRCRLKIFRPKSVAESTEKRVRDRWLYAFHAVRELLSERKRCVPMSVCVFFIHFRRVDSRSRSTNYIKYDFNRTDSFHTLYLLTYFFDKFCYLFFLFLLLFDNIFRIFYF